MTHFESYPGKTMCGRSRDGALRVATEIEDVTCEHCKRVMHAEAAKYDNEVRSYTALMSTKLRGRR